MLTAIMAVSSVGAFAIPAMAQDVDQDIDRNNQITQFSAQSNEACTNTVVAATGDYSDQYVRADQSNKCYVDQDNYSNQYANIDDDSRNILANINLQDFSEED